MKYPAPLVIGLVGGIGSGKSAVAEAFSRQGARVIRADELGHEALRNPGTQEAVLELFGNGILDDQGRIERRRLGAVVFADAAKLRELEAITHPYIRKRISEEIQRAGREGVWLVIVDAAVLFEAGWNDLCDRVVFVEAPEEVRKARVTGKRGWTAGDWQSRELAQLPLTEKHARADHVLVNASTLEHLGKQVEDLLHLWTMAPVPGAKTIPQNQILGSGGH